MKQLKHLKLFEAFESIKLGKTLKFVSVSAKSQFLEALNLIAGRYDFPISKFNDDMFEYLPFKSALRKNVDPPKPKEKEACNRESDTVPGEFCQGGRVKRTWGSYIRWSECPGCGGTGFKPEKKVEPDVQLVKFWFDKDGNWVTVTGCDGQIREQKGIESGYLHTFSRKLSDYIQVRMITHSELLELPTGSIVLFNNRGLSAGTISMVYAEHLGGRRSTYMLQDQYEGSSPSGVDWRIFARHSWIANSSSDFGSAILLEPKVEKKSVSRKEIKQEDAYTWNNLLNIHSLRMSSISSDMEQKLKNAHFAIILDLNKFKATYLGNEYPKVSVTKKERGLRKTGAFVKPEDIKKENIERYISLLIKKFDANKGLSELTKIIPRALGFTNSISFIMRSSNFNNLNSLVGYIYGLMKSPDDFSYYQRNILQILKEIYDRSKERSSKINQNIDEVWKLIDKEGSSSSEEESKYFEAYLELGEFINKKIKSLNIETISDIEVLMRKLNSIRELVESTRLSSLKQIRYLADYLYSNSPEYCYSNIKDTVRSYPDCIENLSEFRKSIDKII